MRKKGIMTLSLIIIKLTLLCIALLLTLITFNKDIKGKFIECSQELCLSLF